MNTEPAQTITRRVVITGLVQGVGYRISMQRKAVALGVRGWVRNRRDGSVEAVIQGPPQPVAEIMAWARHGPRAARVDYIEVEPAEGAFAGFETLPTV